MNRHWPVFRRTNVVSSENHEQVLRSTWRQTCPLSDRSRCTGVGAFANSILVGVYLPGFRIQLEIDIPERPVEIDPLGGACKRFASEAAQAVFASLLTGDDQRILKYFEMLQERGQ